ncbi:PTS glucose transporter subunit IIA [Corynebacterium pseudotuberculosis]|uniref:PTS glucose transporter subunit IIA n=1 Tax=Corynebacterium pseudotuberculosis (strain C231) TaxID=681645 RepID=A0A6D2LIP0_CORP2|nr:PTS glucose transporter subunit IIA [Corynebacterium pseudotuberculosis]ADK27919.1 PTS glucose transporter subunit IIA [Corynebacterium pseudotuberculosis FRC41]AIG06482.1 Phosphotransferase system IIC components, glucose/maltose/N-acetylglucosamine-specific [Corynebacterium pseudotuberculosis]AIG08936.1 Phosphotransferase system IIC components, glucose/maltose/N-acetylglucosamine-specific [Corynebacterium pseudotuberculosis]AIG10830.1 Phosphotransferase system IIC components, glucose/maltos
MFGFAKKKVVVIPPIHGPLLPLSSVNDAVFSSGMMGEGFAVEPDGFGEVVAPVSGKLVTVFKTGHAFAIKTPEGLEVLVHIGLDTVEMGGRGFAAHKASGENVVQGEKLITVDFDAVRAAGYDPVTLVVFTNKKCVDHVELNAGKATVFLN